MLFNSLEFAIFFIVVYLLYINLSHKWQNGMLLVASYVFYGSWDVALLSLILISTILDYFCGEKIYQSQDKRNKKFYLFLSISGNLLILCIFKYFGFFVNNLQLLLCSLNINITPYFIQLAVPIGISFYTFQTMSYTIDIYRGELKPTARFFDFALFVSFFPQLVAGPIERAKNLLPQIHNSRKVTINEFYNGCYLIFWGLFLKMFVADNLGKYIVDPVFDKPLNMNIIKVLITSYAFAFQIFGDFAGYSNIARGLGKCMGFDLMVNFNLPYFAKNPREFWNRWHISLSSWLRDYVYIPLGGNRGGNLKACRSIVITMLLGGLWHGASWNFVIWGGYHALLIIAYRLVEDMCIKFNIKINDRADRILQASRVVIFFHFVCFGWLIFRVPSMKYLVSLMKLIYKNLLNFGPDVGIICTNFMFFSFIVILVQVLQYKKRDLMVIYNSNYVVKIIFYVICYALLMVYGVTSAEQFIYFQF